MIRAFLVLCILLLSACRESAPEALEFRGETMGTTYNVVVVGLPENESADGIVAAIATTLETVNEQMSNWDPESEVSRFNRHSSTDAIAISNEMAKVISTAGDVHEKSEGMFDVTVAPLIELWGFGSGPNDNTVPADVDIRNALATVGHNDMLDVDSSALTMRKTQTQVTVNLAAIAKGFGIDQLASALESRGIENYMVEIGGDLYTRGQNAEGKDWVIGIEKPEPGKRSVFATVSVSNSGMATSGDYRNAFQEDGKRYSQLLNPTNGRPVEHDTASATVIADSAMIADAWATAMLVLGSGKGMLIANRENLAVQFIDRVDTEFKPLSSDAFSQREDAREVASR